MKLIKKIISRGGGGWIMRSLLRQENFDDRALDYFSSTTLKLSDSTVYDPMPLLCYYSRVGGKRMRRDYISSIEEFPELLQAIDSRGGSRPVFLYSKRVGESDVSEDLNRLFLTKRSAPLIEFLNAAEVAAVDESGGLRIVGLDAGGKPYNLGLKRWPSFNITVINSNWNNLVVANDAEKGDFVQIWGFRQNLGELGLAFVFH